MLPLRYLQVGFDASVGDCWRWSRRPPGFDSWDPANDGAIIRTRLRLPRCPGSPAGPGPGPGVSIPGTAWEIFRRFQLVAPTISLQPPDAGITGLPTYVSVAPPTPLSHSETLPGGTLRVEATVSSVDVEWGDGVSTSHALAALRPYPDGSATHTYRTKTCPPDYRATHPSRDRCHPTLEAYPVTVTFRWRGRYRYDSGWVDLGIIERSTTVAYDVDEVVGVLEP